MFLSAVDLINYKFRSIQLFKINAGFKVDVLALPCSANVH